MFQLQKNLKFSKMQIVLIIALTAFVAFGQMPNNSPIPQDKKQRAEQLFSDARKLALPGASKFMDEAVQKFKEAQPLFRELGNKLFEAHCFAWLGRLSQYSPQPRQALEYYNQALPLYIAAGDKYEEETTLHNIGNAYMFLGEPRKAIEYFKRALPLEREIKDKDGEALTLNQIGLIYANLEENKNALEYYIQVLPIYQALGDKTNEVKTLNTVGILYDGLGERQKAIESYKQILPLARAMGDKTKEAWALNNLGAVYSGLGENQKALEYYEQALPIQRSINYQSAEAITLNNIGSVYRDLNQNQKALEFYNQALTIERKIQDTENEALTLNNVGTIYRNLGENQKALEYYNLSLAISKEKNHVWLKGLTLSGIGRVYSALGENQKALDYYNQALPFQRAVGDKAKEARTLGWMQEAYQSLGNARLAIFYGKQAINKYQEMRRAIKGLEKETQQTYLKTVQNAYQKLADLLVAEGRFSEAQQVLALLKEQEYFEYTRGGDDETKNLKGQAKLKPDEQKLVERYNLLADRVSEIGAEFQKLDDKKRRLTEGETLSAAEQKRYEELSAQLTDANAAFKLFLEKELVAELGKPVKKEIDVDRALQEKLRSWGEGTVALYTIAGEDRYRVILTTPTIQIGGKTEIKSADLNKKIFEFRAILQNPAIDPRPLGKELYDILVKPIEKDLRAANAKTLIWSLDGTLRYIPFAALSPDGKTYLVEKYQNAIITSATRQSLSAENEKNWHTLGLGVSTAQNVPDPIAPDEKISFSALPGVKTELINIIKDEQTSNETGLLVGRRLVDADFNAKNFGDSLTKENAEGKRKYTIVHIASHFRLGDDSANSFLLLGGGNTLTLEQISNSPQMKFGNVELVTLSACNTAFGSDGDSTGKEVDSLATFIELRGAKSVMATLWSVADESTQLLMSEFYRLHKENPSITKAGAMQRAQVEMIEGKLKSSGKSAGCRSETVRLDGSAQEKFKCDANAPFAHPFYWSPFVLIGNWR